MLYLVSGIVCLLVWLVLTFLTPVGLGIVHVLLGAGVLLLIRGWVERESAALSRVTRDSRLVTRDWRGLAGPLRFEESNVGGET
jgi:hypothetical protein